MGRMVRVHGTKEDGWRRSSEGDEADLGRAELWAPLDKVVGHQQISSRQAPAPRAVIYGMPIETRQLVTPLRA